MAVRIAVDYQGQLHCSATHAPSGRELETDAPKDNAGRGETFSPTDLVAAALGSCALTTMAIKAAKEGFAFSSGSVSVEKQMTSSGLRRIERLLAVFELSADTPAEHRKRLEEIAATCPVALSLAEQTAVDLHFEYS